MTNPETSPLVSTMSEEDLARVFKQFESSTFKGIRPIGDSIGLDRMRIGPDLIVVDLPADLGIPVKPFRRPDRLTRKLLERLPVDAPRPLVAEVCGGCGGEGFVLDTGSRRLSRDGEAFQWVKPGDIEEIGVCPKCSGSGTSVPRPPDPQQWSDWEFIPSYPPLVFEPLPHDDFDFGGA